MPGDGGFLKKGYPKSSTLKEDFSAKSIPFGGTPIYGNPLIRHLEHGSNGLWERMRSNQGVIVLAEFFNDT